MKKSAVGLWIVVGAQLLVLMFVFVERRSRNFKSTDAPRSHAYADVNGGLKTILQMFKEDCGRFPTMEEGLSALINQPTNDLAKGWHGPYFDPAKVPRDPWGREYVYRYPAIYSTNGYDLYSKGPDGIANDSDDIINWQVPVGVIVPPAPLNHKMDFYNIAREFVILIPFSFAFRILGGFTSREFQALMEKHRLADMIWFLSAVFAVIFFITPQIAGR